MERQRPEVKRARLEVGMRWVAGSMRLVLGLVDWTIVGLLGITNKWAPPWKYRMVTSDFTSDIKCL